MVERIPQRPPVIHPLTDNTKRPLWSVMIPTYNCIGYLKQTLESVLCQDWGEEHMQIEVIDDYSTDGDVEALVKSIGRGRVGFFRQEKNRGSLRNFETCIQRAKGERLHILHGDDQIKAGFYNEIDKLFSTYPTIGAAITGCVEMDEDSKERYQYPHVIPSVGIVDDWLCRIAQRQLINPPAIVVKRSVYETLGSFFAVHYGEDWEMWARIGTRYKVAYSPTYLALYRVHNGNISSNAFASGQNIRDINTVINIIQSYLPVDQKAKIKRRAKHYFSTYFAKSASKLLNVHNKPAIALKQAKGALTMQVNKITLTTFMKVRAKLLLRSIKRMNHTS